MKRILVLGSTALLFVSIALASETETGKTQTQQPATSKGCTKHGDRANAGAGKGGCCMKKNASASVAKKGQGSGGCMMQGGSGRGMQHRHGGTKGMGAGAGMQGSGDHATIHSLIADHQKVKRTVTKLENGVRSDTTSDDPEVAALIRQHVREMSARIEKGQPIRMMDPLFREIFKHADKIEMKIEDIPGGARVTETSSDPNVVPLIQQHAVVVSEFSSEGMERMHQQSPIPDGYDPTK